ncbi:MAG: VOC family protein [Actinobacteria bacterium]|nr:VOC family protein [Actinomycetota bacterium]
MSGRVVHFEIPYDDGERARSFYKAVFDWQMTEIPEMGYTLVNSGPTGDQGPTEPGYIGGGMMQRDGNFTAPNLVIDVDNIEVALEAVNQAGGSTVNERMQVGDMGFSAYFKDTEGNLVGLWESVPQG